MGLSDFPGSFIAVFPLLSSRHGQGPPPLSNLGSPGFRTEGLSLLVRCLGACAGSSTTWSANIPCDGGMPAVAFRMTLPRRHSRVGFSRLNSPARTSPVNASSTPLRTAMHDSGPTWLARPSSYETFIHCILTGFGRRTLSRFPPRCVSFPELLPCRGVQPFMKNVAPLLLLFGPSRVVSPRVQRGRCAGTRRHDD